MVFLSKYPWESEPVPLYIFSPFFLGWLPQSALRIVLVLLLYRLCRLGQEFFAQVLVQVIIPCIVNRHILQAVTQHPLQVGVCVPSCCVIVKETADSGIGCQYAFRFREVGNGVENDVILCIQSWVLRIVLYSDGQEREIIHEALEKITDGSWLFLLSDMGDVLRGDTSLEVSITHFIPSCHIREADGEIGFVGILKPQFLTLPFGEFNVYPPFLQIGNERR